MATPYPILTGMDPTIKSEGSYYDPDRPLAPELQQGITTRKVVPRGTRVQREGIPEYYQDERGQISMPMTVESTQDRPNPFYSAKPKETIEQRVQKEMPRGGY